MSSAKLHDLIRSVRSCKTAAEERACLTRESALMRTSLKEHAPSSSSSSLEQDVLKLLFLHMLGYPTHWGQMACVRLIARRAYHEKRAGYLALMLLLTEGAEVMTLVINTVQQDLRSPDPHRNALALSTTANLGSEELCRAVAPDVLTHLQAGGAYQRKKAAHATVRIALKCPDLVGDLVPKLVANLPERSHSVLLGATTALEEMMTQAKQSHLPGKLVRLVPLLTRVLGKLIGATFARDYVIGGVTDPFLQCRILSLCRRLGAAAAMQQARAAGGTVDVDEEGEGEGDDEDDSEEDEEGEGGKGKKRKGVTDKELARAIQATDCLNDVLARVATKTDTSRNAGHAVLYEAVQTILRTDSEGGLRVLSVNILGKFLLHRDHNIRYVALQALCRVVDTDMDAVRRHRAVIVDCLRDADVSLRRRALDLVVALADSESIGEVAGELVNYLVVASAEERGPLVEKIALVARRYAPTPRWEADCLLMVLSVAGAHARPPVISRLVHLIGALDEDDEEEEEEEGEGRGPLVTRGALARRSIAHKVFAMLLEGTDSTDVQAPMLAVAAWTVGELGADLLLPPPPLSRGGQQQVSSGGASGAGDGDGRADPTVIPRGPLGYRRSPLEVATALCSLLEHHASGRVTKAMTLVALGKLAARFAEAGVQGFRGPGAAAAADAERRVAAGPLADREEGDPSGELAEQAPRGFPATGPKAAVALLRGLRSFARSSDSELQARSVELSAVAWQLVGERAAAAAGAAAGGAGGSGKEEDAEDAWTGDSELQSALAPALSEDDALGLFERMPVLVEDRHAVAAAAAIGAGVLHEAGGEDGEGEGGPVAVAGVGALHGGAGAGEEELSDDDDLLAMGTESASRDASHGGAAAGVTAGAIAAAGGAGAGGGDGDDDDLLAMLGGGSVGAGGAASNGGAPASAPAPAPAAGAGAEEEDEEDLFGGGSAAAGGAAETPSGPPLPSPISSAVPGGDLTVSVEFAAVREDPPETDVVVVARLTPAGAGKGQATGVRIESAVPKYMKQRLGTPSGSSIDPSGATNEVRLPVTLINPKRGQGKGLQIRLRVHWTLGGASQSQTVAVKGMPSTL